MPKEQKIGENFNNLSICKAKSSAYDRSTNGEGTMDQDLRHRPNDFLQQKLASIIFYQH